MTHCDARGLKRKPQNIERARPNAPRESLGVLCVAVEETGDSHEETGDSHEVTGDSREVTSDFHEVTRTSLFMLSASLRTIRDPLRMIGGSPRTLGDPLDVFRERLVTFDGSRPARTPHLSVSRRSISP
jgi:hypothetical protein